MNGFVAVTQAHARTPFFCRAVTYAVTTNAPTDFTTTPVLDTIVEMLRDLKGEGLAMLLVEQNVETAIELADRVVILDQGAKVFEGSPDRLTFDEQVAIRYLGVGV